MSARAPFASIVAALQKDVGRGSPDLEMSVRFLASRGLRVTLICEKSAESPLEGMGEDGFKYDIVSKAESGRILPRLARHFRYTWRLLKARLRGADLFYVCEAPMCPGALLALLGVPHNRVVYHAQNFIDPLNQPLQVVFEKLMCRRAALVVYNDESRARFAQSLYRLREQPLVVRTAMPRQWPGHIDCEPIRERLLMGAPTGAKLVLHQGPFSPDRMSPQVLRALAMLPPRYRLVVTGVQAESVDKSRCFGLASTLGLEDRLVFTGYLHFNDLAAYTGACDVGVLLYPNDGVGNYFKAPGRLTQYIGCGVPVVTSEFPALENLVLRHGLGAACDPTSPEAIAAALTNVCEEGNESRDERAERLTGIFRDCLAYEHQGERLAAAVIGMLSKSIS